MKNFSLIPISKYKSEFPLYSFIRWKIVVHLQKNIFCVFNSCYFSLPKHWPWQKKILITKDLILCPEKALKTLPRYISKVFRFRIHIEIHSKADSKRIPSFHNLQRERWKLLKAFVICLRKGKPEHYVLMSAAHFFLWAHSKRRSFLENTIISNY